jgi:hypothetical protein
MDEMLIRFSLVFDTWMTTPTPSLEPTDGSVVTRREGGRCGAGGRPATVNHNGGGLELGVGRVEARRGKIESGTRCGGVLWC